MKRYRIVLGAVALALVLPALVSAALLWDFTQGGNTGANPGASANITLSTIGTRVSTCGISPADQPAVIQVLTGSIYFIPNSPNRSATGDLFGTNGVNPVPTDFQANTGDLISTNRSNSFVARAVTNTANIKVQCISR
jgi:hypothetical protein